MKHKNNTNAPAKIAFRLRILSAVIGFPQGAFIVEDHQNSVYAVRGGPRESAIVYPDGIAAMKAQEFCATRGVPSSIVAEAE